MDEQPHRISRRRVLKRLGLGSAVVWSAPIMTTIRMPVYAQASPTCAPFDCANQVLCGHPGAGCPMPPGCERAGCVLLEDDSCLCFTRYDCFDGERPICQTDADCEANGFPGHRCGRNVNCGCTGSLGCYLPCQP